MKRLLPLFLLSLALSAPHISAENPDWHLPFPAFRIAGNLYYVGTADLAVYLIKTSKGNILINSDFPQDLPLIRNSIKKLGLKYRDTRIILISHAHDDHDAAVSQIEKETCARLMVMEPDVASVESTAAGHPGAKVDRVLHDGDTVSLGGATLTGHLTPGHTKGCTTWTFKTTENGKSYDVVIVGSLSLNAAVLVNNPTYPNIQEDYVKSFKLMRSLPADVFVGSHNGFYQMEQKHALLDKGGANPYIDPAGYKALIDSSEKAFNDRVQELKSALAR